MLLKFLNVHNFFFNEIDPPRPSSLLLEFLYIYKATHLSWDTAVILCVASCWCICAMIRFYIPRTHVVAATFTYTQWSLWLLPQQLPMFGSLRIIPVSNIACFCCIYVCKCSQHSRWLNLLESISCFQRDVLYLIISTFITVMLYICLWGHSCFCVGDDGGYMGRTRGLLYAL